MDIRREDLHCISDLYNRGEVIVFVTEDEDIITVKQNEMTMYTHEPLDRAHDKISENRFYTFSIRLVGGANYEAMLLADVKKLAKEWFETLREKF